MFGRRWGKIPFLLEQVTKQFDHRAHVRAARLAYPHKIPQPYLLSRASIPLGLSFDHGIDCIRDVVSGLFPLGEWFGRCIGKSWRPLPHGPVEEKRGPTVHFRTLG